MKQEKNQNRASKSCGSILSGLVSNMYITGIPEEERTNRREALCGDVTAANFPELIQDTNPQTPAQ